MLVSLEEAKSFLDVIHDDDDVKLQMLLDAAIDEAVQYLGYASPAAYEDFVYSSENPDGLPASFTIGVLFLLQANYQAPPDDIPKLRKAAESKLFPYRIGFGI